ncbi:hypothetical protein ACFT0G_19870 [Streptomyces sp. NPDC057020]|uniref:hypothetical protein n=1 Tax=unclassified Streptomyces TaxID=2593676 RepID=UPI000939641C|nr:hypothetical protein [Streptomyces sp. CB02009]OKJ50455.1 hypothetical protein AMK27_34875 [Streptomyces sp. CB02009]
MNISDVPDGDPIRLLIGHEVSAVSFVRDYVELHFDGPVLRCLADPVGVYDGSEWRFPEPGSLDLMRNYIGETVDDSELDPDRIIALRFGRHRFVVPLDDGSSRGPESAHMIGTDETGRTSILGGFWVW